MGGKMQRFIPLIIAALVGSASVAAASSAGATAVPTQAPSLHYAMHQFSGIDRDGKRTTTTVVSILKPGATATLPRSGFSSGVTPDAPGNTTDCRDDSADLVKGCTQLNWVEISCFSGLRCYNLQYSNITYYKDDPGAGGIQGRYVEGIGARCAQGCGAKGYYSGTKDFFWHTITSGQTYKYNSPWSGKYCLEHAKSTDEHGGTNYMDWYFRTHHYTFNFQTLLPET
jgi:hypothetical protein